MEIAAAHRRRPARPATCSRTGCGEGAAVVRLLADRDLSARGDRGRVLRRPHPDAGRPGAAGRCAPARRCTAGRPLVRPGRPGGPAAPRGADRRHRPSGRWTPGPPATQRLADAFATGIARAPAGLAHAAATLADDLPAPSRHRRAGDERSGAAVSGCGHRDRLPVLVRRPRRGAEPRPRPGRGADRARPRGRACWRPADEDADAAAVRGAGRAGGAGPLQRLGRPARRSARCPPPGCGAGCATAAFDVLHVHEPIDAEPVAARASCPRAGRSSPPSTPR